MKTKISGKSMAVAATPLNLNDGQGEYNLPNDDPSGQEWILDAYSALEPRSYLREFTSQNVRPDGRPFSASRPVSVLPSIFARNSHGSAMVTLGGGDTHGLCCTRVVAACTLLVGRPSPSTPDEGDVDVTLTASPLSGPRFDVMGREGGDLRSGDYGASADRGNGGDGGLPPPGNNDLPNVVTRGDGDAGRTPSPTDVKEIESWIRRVLRSSRMVDPTELGIERGASAWRIRISIHLLNHEGNVRDAALLCACAALSDVRLPMVEIGEGGMVRIAKDDGGGDGGERSSSEGGNEGKARRRKGRSLALGPIPVPLTVAVLPNDGQPRTRGSKNILLLADPVRLEEDVAAGNTVTAVCNANEEIVEFHKKGSASRLSTEQVAAVACMGFARAKELEKLVFRR